MVSKVQERIFAEKAATLLAADWMLKDIPEPLDFEVRTAAETFGLEVRQIFVDVETHFGSAMKRSEKKTIDALSLLAKKYYEEGGLPISAQFLGVVSSINSDAILKCMLQSAPKYSGGRVTVQAPQVKVFMSPLPEHFMHYSRWKFVNDRVGWLKKVSRSDLQGAIDKKALNLAAYKQKYEHIELLLVADRVFNSGKLISDDLHNLINPGFRNIYFMSYPESIQRIG